MSWEMLASTARAEWFVGRSSGARLPGIALPDPRRRALKWLEMGLSLVTPREDTWFHAQMVVDRRELLAIEGKR